LLAPAGECELDIYGNIRNIRGSKTFIPFRYQGQYEDEETGLYYNRFRYHSSESGNYISQDPIGLQGGLNQYAYVHDTNDWVDIFGLAPWPNGKMGEWWDSPTTTKKDIIDNIDSVKDALRRMHGGSNHEKFPVSQAPKAKELGYSFDELTNKNMVIKTADTFFENVPDANGNLLSGPHVSSGVNNSEASANFHKGLINRLKAAKTKKQAKTIVTQMHNKHLRKHH
jgi:RHS repeat-associated protein